MVGALGWTYLVPSSCWLGGQNLLVLLSCPFSFVGGLLFVLPCLGLPLVCCFPLLLFTDYMPVVSVHSFFMCIWSFPFWLGFSSHLLLAISQLLGLKAFVAIVASHFSVCGSWGDLEMFHHLCNTDVGGWTCVFEFCNTPLMSCYILFNQKDSPCKVHDSCILSGGAGVGDLHWWYGGACPVCHLGCDWGCCFGSCHCLFYPQYWLLVFLYVGDVGIAFALALMTWCRFIMANLLYLGPSVWICYSSGCFPKFVVFELLELPSPPWRWFCPWCWWKVLFIFRVGHGVYFILQHLDVYFIWIVDKAF